MLEIGSCSRSEFIDITGKVREAVGSSGMGSGLCTVFVMHTTAGITINEGADPDVQRDMLDFLNRQVPVNGGYRHGEGNSDAHIKSTLVGSSVTIPVEGGKLLLGTWQAIYLCEFDGPRRRTVAVKLLSDR